MTELFQPIRPLGDRALLWEIQPPVAILASTTAPATAPAFAPASAPASAPAAAPAAEPREGAFVVDLPYQMHSNYES